MPDDNETKDDLLKNVRRERAKLDALLTPLDEAGMLIIARDDGWTAKDILAHVTAWEQRLLRWIERWHETENPGRPEVGVTWDGFDVLNEQDYQAAKHRPLVDVRGDAAESHEAVMRVLDTMSGGDLALHPETPEGPTWAWIAGANTYRHYKEHREEMEAWWKEHAL